MKEQPNRMISLAKNEGIILATGTKKIGAGIIDIVDRTHSLFATYSTRQLSVNFAQESEYRATLSEIHNAGVVAIGAIWGEDIHTFGFMGEDQFKCARRAWRSNLPLENTCKLPSTSVLDFRAPNDLREHEADFFKATPVSSYEDFDAQLAAVTNTVIDLSNFDGAFLVFTSDELKQN
jgi:hypothetical protein